MGVFITPFGIYPLAAEKGIFALPVDRPVDRPTVKKVTVEPSGRPPGRPCQIQRAIALWLVDRPVDRDKVNGRPPSRPAAPESRLTSAGRPLGRPAKSLGLCARLVHIGRPVRSTDHWSGRPSRSTARAWQVFFRI